MHHQQFYLVDFILCELENVIADSIKMGRFMPYVHLISYILAGSMGRQRREAGTDVFMEYIEQWSSLKTTFPDYRPTKVGDRRHGQRALVPILQQLSSEQHTQAAAEDEALRSAEHEARLEGV